MRLSDESFGLLKRVFKRFLISLRVAVDRAVVNERGRTRFALADVDVGVWEVVLLEPLDHFYPQLARCDPRTFEHILSASRCEDRDLCELCKLLHEL